MELEFGVLHKATLPFILKKKHTAHCGDLKYKISTNSMFLIFSNIQTKAKKIFQILISRR